MPGYNALKFGAFETTDDISFEPYRRTLYQGIVCEILTVFVLSPIDWTDSRRYWVNRAQSLLEQRLSDQVSVVIDIEDDVICLGVHSQGHVCRDCPGGCRPDQNVTVSFAPPLALEEAVRVALDGKPHVNTI